MILLNSKIKKGNKRQFQLNVEHFERAHMQGFVVERVFVCL